MALLFIDGFDHYATADLSKKGWTLIATTGVMTVNASAGRRGGGGLQYSTTLSVEYDHALPAALATVIVGFAFKWSSGLSVPVMNLYDSIASTRQLTLGLNSSGMLTVRRGATSGTLLGTSTLALTSGTFYYIELKATIHPSAGTVEVRVNGDVWLSLTGQNTRASANSWVNSIRLGVDNNANASASTTIYDDLYVADTSGSANNDFLGDSRVDTLYPSADGTYTAFTPSTGTSHYACVDETLLDATDYVSASTSGNKDSYAFTDLSNSTVIYGVQVNNACYKDDAGARTVANLVRSGSTDAQSSASGLATSSPVYKVSVHETDPATSAAWTESGVNAAEFGTVVAS